MDEFYSGEQVVFKTDNEYLIGMFLFMSDLMENHAVIMEGGIRRYIPISAVYKPYDIMDGEREGYEN